MDEQKWRHKVAEMKKHYDSLDDSSADLYLKRWFANNNVDKVHFPAVKFILDNTVVEGLVREIANIMRPEYVEDSTREVILSVRLRYVPRTERGGEDRVGRAVAAMKKAANGFEFIREVEIERLKPQGPNSTG